MPGGPAAAVLLIPATESTLLQTRTTFILTYIIFAVIIEYDVFYNFYLMICKFCDYVFYDEEQFRT